MLNTNAESRWKSVPISESEAEAENCTNGRIPETDGSSEPKTVEVPVVTSMTKYLFSKVRLKLYTYLNQNLKNGFLARDVGFPVLNHVIRKENCEFLGVSFWRIDRLNFYADIRTKLLLATAEGPREWEGYLVVWVNAEEETGFEFSVEELCAASELDRDGMTLLSPFLIPYFSASDIDDEAEKIWFEEIPEALTSCIKRDTSLLAERLGLKILPYPLHGHRTVDSILFLKEDTIRVDGTSRFDPIEEVTVPPMSVVINTNRIKTDYSDFNIYHEIFHYYEHYLFFRLQEMGHNDITEMKTETIPVSGETMIENPVYWMEKQANRGAYALMMPRTDFVARLEKTRNSVTGFRHEGERYELLCEELRNELYLPAFRIRNRAIQMGHVMAKGAVNYADRERIKPFSFEPESLYKGELTFVIDSRTVGRLAQKDPDLRQLLENGKYLYADGHLVRNDPRFVRKDLDRMVLTDWASAHADQCCLRFVRTYVQKNAGQYVLGRMYYDVDYARQTRFYLDDIIKEKAVDELDAQSLFRSRFPRTFKSAFDYLLHRKGLNRETVAEWLEINDRTLLRWLSSPDTRITPDFVMFFTLKLQLPDWLSDLLLRRAHIQLDMEDKRHQAFRYIQRVLWMDGLEKANEYLQARKLEPISLKNMINIE